MIYTATVQLDIYGIIGLNIKNRRIELGMTQTELAMMCNMPRTSLSKFEAAVNKIPIDTLELICTNLNCKISEMFDYALHICQRD